MEQPITRAERRHTPDVAFHLRVEGIFHTSGNYLYSFEKVHDVLTPERLKHLLKRTRLPSKLLSDTHPYLIGAPGKTLVVLAELVS